MKFERTADELEIWVRYVCTEHGRMPDYLKTALMEYLTKEHEERKSSNLEVKSWHFIDNPKKIGHTKQTEKNDCAVHGMAICDYMLRDQLDLKKIDHRSYIELRCRILLLCFQRQLLMGHEDGHHYD